MSRIQVGHVTIPASMSVSAAFGMRGAGNVAIMLPVMPQSTAAFLQGSFVQETTNPASASFARVSKIDGSGDFEWSLGNGMEARGVHAEVLRGFTWGRIELGVVNRSVTDVRTATIMQQF